MTRGGPPRHVRTVLPSTEELLAEARALAGVREVPVLESASAPPPADDPEHDPAPDRTDPRDYPHHEREPAAPTTATDTADEELPPEPAPRPGAKPPLLALTVHQPWAWALAGAWKVVENREWPPPASLFGRHLAIHAGLRYDEAAARELAQAASILGLPRPPPPARELARGAIVAVARIAGAVQVEPDGTAEEPRLRVVAVRGHVSDQEAHELAGSAWASGPWLWVARDVVALPTPVACRGFQKLWTVPAEVADLVRAGWKAARAAAAAAPTPTPEVTTR